VFFRKSVAIAKAHQTLAGVVEKVDELIYSIEDHPIRPDQVSDNIGIDEALLRRILGLYADDVLRRESRRYCGECDLLIDETDNPKECDNCEAKFTQISPKRVEVFAPVNPIIRVELDEDEDNISPLAIQFVGGDRAGGQKNQLQVPKEFTRIKSGIKGTQHSDLLDLLSPVIAATMEELGTLYTNKPRLIHFSGHGDNRSLSFVQDQELLAATVALTASRLASILQAYPTRVSVVVFNTCDSASLADHLVTAGCVDIAIGWEGRVTDAVAIAFAEQFYAHLGNGLTTGAAFVLASECSTPEGAAFRGVIRTRDGVDANAHYLLNT
jgi:hypothetical protein